MSQLNRNLLYALSALILGALIWYFSDIVAYLLIAWVFSMIGRPLVLFYMKRVRLGRIRIGSGVAALLTIVTFYLALAALLMLFVPTIVSQARTLAEADYHALGEKMRGPFTWVDVQAHQYGLLAQGESLATKIQETLITWFKPALVGDYIGSFISTAGNVMVAMASITFILFFFLEENRLFEEIIHAVVPDHQESKVRHAVQDSSGALTGYFRGLLIQIGIFSMMLSILLAILGVPNALLIGVFGGLLNVVPYVGPIIGLVLGCFITLTSHISADFSVIWPLLAKVSIVFLVVQAIDNMLVSTIIFSKSVQAHPLEIFIVTLMAAKIGGVAGMILGIPVYTVLRVIARTFFSEFKVVQRLTDHLDSEENG